jgi:hypothetical protein
VNWRAKHPVLVVQAETLGALAVIRSLGRAGYPVHACSTDQDALGLSSRYAARESVCPDYQSEHFLSWLGDYVRRAGIDAIIPSEGLLLRLRPVFSEFAPLLCCIQDPQKLFAGLSKFDMFERLIGSTPKGENHLPPTLLVGDIQCPPSIEDVRRLPTPLYVKVDGTYALYREKGAVFQAASPEDAMARLGGLASRYRKAVIQGHVPGRGVGVFFLIHQGEVMAEFMHLRLHEVPHTGGVSSLRRSWRHPVIREDALSKLRRMNWEGVAMMEYRWDPASNAFYFLEMNGRFWGSLHLALWAGIDFPRLLLDAFHCCPLPAAVESYSLGVRCRYTYPGELQYVWSRWRDPELSLLQRVWSVFEFFLLSLNPRIHSDLFFPGDRGLYFAGLSQALGLLKRLLARQTMRKCNARA